MRGTPRRRAPSSRTCCPRTAGRCCGTPASPCHDPDGAHLPAVRAAGGAMAAGRHGAGVPRPAAGGAAGPGAVAHPARPAPQPGRAAGAAAVSAVRHAGHRGVPAGRCAGRLGAGPVGVPRPADGAGAGHRAAGAAAGGRRGGAAARAGPPRGARPVPGRLVRRHPAVLHRGGGAGRGVRGDAVPGDRGGGRAARDGPPVRGGGGHPGGVPVDGVPAGHAAAGRARYRGRRGAVLDPGTGRVRRDDHVRRQLPGPYPDGADRCLPGVGDRPGRRGDAEPGADRGVGGGARRAARPLGRRAGGMTLAAGRVALGDTVLDDRAAGVWVPPEHRPVGYVFADHRLFPHLSAADNIAFGLRARGMRRAAARAVAAQWLARVGVAELAAVRPGRLSSGQAQRVALARALAPRPRLLLLDEPPSALDAGTRAALRTELRRLVGEYEGCCLAVTHDPLDALVLADRIAVLEAGRIVQAGTPAEVARHPRTDHVARLVGLNLYRGTGVGGAVVGGAVVGGGVVGGGVVGGGVVGGGVVRLADGTELVVAEPVHGPAFVAFPPTAVAVHRSRPDGSPRNCWPATVAELEPHGSTIRVRLVGRPQAYADVTAAAVAELGLAPGRAVWAAVKATELAVYPA